MDGAREQRLHHGPGGEEEVADALVVQRAHELVDGLARALGVPGQEGGHHGVSQDPLPRRGNRAANDGVLETAARRVVGEQCEAVGGCSRKLCFSSVSFFFFPDISLMA